MAMRTPGGINAALANGRAFTENWDNLDAWDLNVITIQGAWPPGGTATVASNEFIVDSYPTDGGPVLSRDTPNIGDFTFSGSLSIQTNNANRGNIAVAICKSSNPDDNKIMVRLEDTSGGSSEAVARVQVVDGGVGGNIDTQSSANSGGIYTINYVFERVGSTVTYTITGDLSTSGSFTFSGLFDTLAAQIQRESGFTAPPYAAVLPLELEY